MRSAGIDARNGALGKRSRHSFSTSCDPIPVSHLPAGETRDVLDSIFIIFMFQLVGEAAQKYFALPVPGPVIGLVLMLVCLLWTKRTNLSLIADQRDRLVTTSQQLLGYLSLLFVPIGVGVIMHLQLLEAQWLQIIAIIVIGTIGTMIFTAFIFLKTSKAKADE